MIRTFAVATLLVAGMAGLAADDPPVEPKKEPVDVAKTAERIVQNANEAGKRLHAKDPGEDTRKLQQEILKDIDALIRKAQEPPPPDQNMGGGMSNMNNMGGGMSKQQTMGNEGSSTGPLSRRERRERARQNVSNMGGGMAQQPQPMSDPFRADPKIGMNPKDAFPNRIDPKAATPRIPDVYKEVWGHLPEKMRQEMDLYFRDRFMPRYSELLRQYYSSLAERGGKTGP